MEPLEDDRLLAARARDGDHTAYAELVDRYGGRLHAMLLHLCAGDSDLAAEFTQEAFVRAFERLDLFAGGSSFYTWLYRLARNRAIDLLARRKPVAMADEHLADIPQIGASTPIDRLAAEEQRVLVHAGMSRISPEHREVLLLREWDGMDYDQIAIALGIALGTVKSRLNRARAELRAVLAPHVCAEDL